MTTWKSYKRMIMMVALIVLLTLLLVAGCIVSLFFISDNVREYTRANITFRARPIRKGNNYAHLIVGAPLKPYAGHPPIMARLPDGSVVNLADVSIHTLKGQASAISDVSGTRCHEIAAGNLVGNNSRWPDGTLRLQLEVWLFFVHDDQILAFKVWNYNPGYWTGEVAAIGKPANGELYEFPLTEEQVIKVFGKPDSIREYLEE